VTGGWCIDHNEVGLSALLDLAYFSECEQISNPWSGSRNDIDCAVADQTSPNAVKTMIQQIFNKRFVWSNSATAEPATAGVATMKVDIGVGQFAMSKGSTEAAVTLEFDHKRVATAPSSRETNRCA